MGSRARQSVDGGDSLDPSTHQIADGKRPKLSGRVRLQCCPLGWRGSCRKSFKGVNAERASGSSLESRLVSLIAANSTTIIPNYLRQEVEVALYVGLRVSEVCLIFPLRVSVGEAAARRSLVRRQQGLRREELGKANRGRSLGVPPRGVLINSAPLGISEAVFF